VSAGAADRIRSFLERQADDGLVTILGSASRAWDVMVPSYWKESIAVSIELRERTLRAEAFFMRAPEDNAGRAYRLLLERNQTSRAWRFGASDVGDVWLIAEIGLEAVDDEELDRLLGGLVTLIDETYRPYFRLAFERALEAQIARGGPGLDQEPPWAASFGAPPP
jgi:hypothetical protein